MGRSAWDWFQRHRAVFVAALHMFLSALAFYAAFALRLDSLTPWREHYGRIFLTALPVLLVIRFGIFLASDLFRGMWRYVSIADLMNIIRAVTLGTALLVPLAVFWLARGRDYSRSIFVMDWAFCILLLGGVRFAIRAFREQFLPMDPGSRRALILGAGDAGEMLLREMKTHQHFAYLPVGFLDDDPRKWGMRIHGVKVLGALADLRKVAEREEIDEVIIAISSASGRRTQEIVDVCGEMSVRVRRIPTETDIIRLTRIRDVEIEDLLERDPIHLDEERIGEGIRGHRILVTGAGGSIGSEIVRQVARFGPEHICLVDWSENSLFYLDRDLLDHCPGLSFRPVIADIRDRDRMEAVLGDGRFHHVYHAAAFKHVPLMEANPAEAVKNNVMGTRILAECAYRSGVAKFVLISSDKAVRPSSVMGATKRAAELLLSSMPGDRTSFLSVRFGNVMGSQGSVIPLFRKQIADGGPVTVTDPEVVRYFMTIPEAVQLVLQAGAMGGGGEVFLLDMGKPVKIADLARKLITLSGLRPDEDIAIRYVGLRPGEKLYEELLIEAEGVQRTEHRKIWVLDAVHPPADEVQGLVDRLIASADRAEEAEIIRSLAVLVPEYRPHNEGFRRLLESQPVEHGE